MKESKSPAGSSGPSLSRRLGRVFAVVGTQMARFVDEVTGAAADHRKWIRSSRAQTLEAVFHASGWLLTLFAYLSLAYLGYRSWLNIESGLAAQAYPVVGIRDSQTALFAVFAASLMLPIALIGGWIAVGTFFNVMVAMAQRILARLVWPLIRPVMLAAVVAALSMHQPFVESSIARGYLHAQAVIVTATGRTPPVAIPVVDIEGTGLPNAIEHAHQQAMDRIRCADETQLTEQCAATVLQQ